MSYINENFLKLQESYLFSTVAKKVAEYSKNNPDKEIIKLGIGDVTKPIVPACLEAMHKAVDEIGTMSRVKTSHRSINDDGQFIPRSQS